MRTRQEILSLVTEVFREELQNESLELDFDSSPKTVDNWDSINNLVLLTSIEDALEIEFPIDFIFSIETVGDICDFILSAKENL